MAKRSVKSRGKTAPKPATKATAKKAKPAKRPKVAAKRVGKGKGAAKATSAAKKPIPSKASPAPANENVALNKPTPPTIATIAPRGVFLPDRVVVDIEGDTFPSTKLDEHGRDEAILPGATLEQIKLQAAEGQRLVAGDPSGAFRVFRAALELLPQPHQNWNAAGWLLVAMGECAVQAGDWPSAILPLKDAMHCPGTIGNPWVHLRLGQVRLELADERAADDLARAYMGGGRSVFDGLDAKYFALVEKVLQPPPGHDRLP